MKHRHYLSTMAIAALISFTACTSEDYKDDPAFKDVTVDLKDLTELPVWLANYIVFLEYVPEGKEIPSEPAGFYRFEWNGNTYYEYYSTSQNAMHTEIYTAEGKPYILMEEDYKSFSDGVRNWTLVYLLQPSNNYSHISFYPSEVPDSINNFFERQFNHFGWNGFVFQYQNIDNDVADCYVINSTEQLERIYVGIDHIPQIDFSRYTLILGKVPIPNGYSLIRQKITKAGEYSTLDPHPLSEHVLWLSFVRYENDDRWGNEKESYNFWALYPKMNEESVEVYVLLNYFITHHYAWETSRVPEVSEIQEAAAKMIIGNWELIKSTETDSLNIYANLQFDADGKAEYEGTSNNDYRVLYYKLLPGWSENDGELSGYISFIIWGDPSENNRHERFYCVFRADGEMRLIRNNHPGEISTVPPEVYRFKRVSIEK